jgi:hypothetical protein
MEQQGLTRDTITYSSTISALSKSKHWSSAIQVPHYLMCCIDFLFCVMSTFALLTCRSNLTCVTYHRSAQYEPPIERKRVASEVKGGEL